MHKFLYMALLGLGIGSFIYIYFYNFNNYTEEQLVRLSFQWALPIVFGAIGLITERSPRPERSLTFAALGTGLAALGLAGGLMLIFG